MSFGDEVSVEIKPRLEDMDFIATPMDIDVVYEDDDILVINKPARLVVHPAAGHWDDTLLNGLLAYNSFAVDFDQSGSSDESGKCLLKKKPRLYRGALRQDRG